MTNLHDPAPRAVIRMLLLLLPFLAARSDMGDVAPLLGLLPTVGKVVALIATQVLRLVRGRRWSFDHDRIERIREQLHIIPVRSGDHERDGNAFAFGQHAALGAGLATVRGIGPRGLAPKGAFTIAPSMLCQVHSSPWRSS